MRIPIASDGWRFIVPLLLLTILFAALSMPWPAGVSFLGLAFVTNFFRDPERAIPQEENVIVSPADGKVVEIVEDQDPLLNEPSLRVSIFLNVFNVHVNRMPIAGKVEKIYYNPGKFLNAANPKASLDNEQNTLVINNGEQKILVKQIAGLIARRIVCWVREGEYYPAGHRFGLIRFGSRTDLFLPTNTKIDVAVGDKVKGGCHIIGYLRKPYE